jgi:SAM-dependent methyltransferase
MRNRQWFDFLEDPRLYRIVQFLAAPGAEKALHRELLCERGARVRPRRALDVGCGPVSMLEQFAIEPIGVDASPSYVQAFAGRGRTAIVGTADALPVGDGLFDEVWSFGLFHHLPDDMARETVAEMIRATRDGGWTIVFDAVLPSPTMLKLLPYFLRRMDRGRHVRTERDNRSLFPEKEGWSMRRFRYSFTGLEGVVCSRKKFVTPV